MLDRRKQKNIHHNPFVGLVDEAEMTGGASVTFSPAKGNFFQSWLL
jgi:hypothetical protein